MIATTHNQTYRYYQLRYVTYILLITSCAAPTSNTIDNDRSFQSAGTRNALSQCTQNCYWVEYTVQIYNCRWSNDDYCETIVKRYSPNSAVRRTYLKSYQGFHPGSSYEYLGGNYDRFVASAAELESPGLALDFYDATSDNADTPFDRFSLSISQEQIQNNVREDVLWPVYTVPSSMPAMGDSRPYVEHIDVKILPARINGAYQLLLTSADLSNCSDNRVGGSCDTYFRWSASEWQMSATMPRKTIEDELFQLNSDCSDSALPYSSCWRSGQIQSGNRVAAYDDQIVVLSDSDLKFIDAGSTYKIRFEPYERDTGLLTGNDDGLGSCTLTIDANTLQQLYTGYTIPTCGDVKNVTFKLTAITTAAVQQL